MGDVALTIPVLKGVLIENPELEITIVTNVNFAPLFHGIDRLTFHGVNFQDYAGFSGLRRLFKELKALQPWDVVLDLHSVMRTWVLTALFKLSGYKVFTIDKGREAKAELVSQKHRKLKQLPHTTERYLKVFNKAGFIGIIMEGDCIHVNNLAAEKQLEFLTNNGLTKEHVWLGLAPFSKHVQKEWPLAKVNELIKALSLNDQYKILLLGGGSQEVKLLKQIASENDHVHNLAGVLNLEEEISLIHQLDCVVSMDSFNMHLAALSDIKVVSIWGATHSFAGFGPLNGNEAYIVETSTDDLSCRPCSVFGSKPCSRGDLACLERITVPQVIEKIELALA